MTSFERRGRAGSQTSANTFRTARYANGQNKQPSPRPRQQSAEPSQMAVGGKPRLVCEPYATDSQRIVKTPFMPAAAWPPVPFPPTVHRYGYFPALVNVTVSLAVVLFWMSGVLLPLISKVCPPRPMFLTTNVTFPRRADLAESVNPNSNALTWIVV